MNSTTIPEVTHNGSKYIVTIDPFISALNILDIIVGIIAILINGLTIYILTVKLKLKQSDTILSFIVSVFDVIFSIFMIIDCLVLWITNHSAVLVILYSQFVGYLCFCLGSCAIDSVALLSLLRFLAICKNVKYSNRFWIRFILGLATFNFIFGLIPLIQKKFKVQPSLKYSFVEFDIQNNWSINFYHCFSWIKLIINTIVIIVCYVFISSFYYNYLKNFRGEEVQEGEELPKVNRRDLDGIQFDTGSIQLDLDKDNNCQRKEEMRKAKDVGKHIIENSVMSTEQSDFHNNYTIDNLMRSTLSKIYIMLIIYMLEWVPFFIVHVILKSINIPISSTLDGVVNFLIHFTPITNPCFVLFFHFETYQELRFFIYLNYYKFFN
ncbi:family A G protein-coupled receptor-like protein [Conidiobolus coronatus NRRL 28638]|uniref:Family A G protein-coupled receptor-like protein n=1 Tax=Conidiobolus coronatus (strain ATCC 28846 / CBS 209.66 / NRRL 28638) TaxID=796925 RepID=A0A137NUE3_CONC2|nr:family A G protein-coupled receptor-like protein [Conidiobolus coronatus NRRL 28638]|eukprot:KXN66400.1 family A G protein-coupled receptor-like protein [Conidiobolus coronatus NRRL 28638]